MSVPHPGILSKSSVMISLPSTLAALRRVPFRVPPTKPPISFRSSCCVLGILMYSAWVSVPTIGCVSLAYNAETVVFSCRHILLLRLLPTDITICLSGIMTTLLYVKPSPERGRYILNILRCRPLTAQLTALTSQCGTLTLWGDCRT